MHAIARFSAESVRISGVSATRNSFVRSVEFLVNRMVNETNERNKPVRFVRPKGSFIRTGSRTNEPTLVSISFETCSASPFLKFKMSFTESQSCLQFLLEKASLTHRLCCSRAFLSITRSSFCADLSSITLLLLNACCFRSKHCLISGVM